MCGIYGAVSFGEALPSSELGEAMGRQLAHRGPDGHAIRRKSHVLLGTERLRVIDLHPRADQPFSSPDDGVWLACNGEIYNAPELRRRFADYPFTSLSDVESILPLYSSRGLDAVEELDGMFGLAIWDEGAGRLLLARDRAGEKPLFYSRVGDAIYFASEVQALLEVPGVDTELDREALAQFLALGYVLEPRSMFTGIRRVEAGTILSFDARGVTRTVYWDPVAIASQPVDGEDAVPRVRSLLEAAVGKQVMSDVPVGVFTSGGLDSSLLAVLAARTLGADRVHTFTARFVTPSYDESPFASRVAKMLGTRHEEIHCDEPALRRALDHVTENLAEPLADPAILPTFLVSERARESVTVVLSGEGADELFGGYPTYLGHQFAPWYNRLPRPLRGALRAALERLPPSDRKVTLGFLLKKFVHDAEQPWLERHLRWFGTGLVGLERSGASETSGVPGLEALGAQLEGLPLLTAAPLFDYRTYLRDGLLVKVDRATMLNSLEARAPFLDRDLSAYALALPPELKVRRLTTKWVLKQAAGEWLPREIIERKKRGLSVPVATWINDGLRAEVDRLLEPGRLRGQGLLDPELTTAMLAEHRAGKADHTRALWASIVFQRWFERWEGRIKKPSSAAGLSLESVPSPRVVAS